MSGVLFMSTYAAKGPLPSYLLEDTLYPSHREISTQAVAEQAQANGEFSGTPEELRVCNDGGHLREKGMLEHYLQSATIHGVAQTNGPLFYNYRRPVWLVLILGMAVMLGLTLHSEISHMYEYPSRTVTRVNLKDELTFPAVTICNLNQFYIDRVPNIPIVQALFKIQSDYTFLTKDLLNSPANLSILDTMVDISGEELQRISRTAAPRLDELLVQCTWSFMSYNCSDLFKPLRTGYGMCFVFNGPDVPPEELVKAYGGLSKLRVIGVLDNDRSYFSALIHAGLKVRDSGRSYFSALIHAGLKVRDSDRSYFSALIHAGLKVGDNARSYFSALIHAGLKVRDNDRSYFSALIHAGHKVRDNDRSYFSALIHAGLKVLIHEANEMPFPMFDGSYVRPGVAALMALSRSDVAQFTVGPLCSAKQILTCYSEQMHKVKISTIDQCHCPKECYTVSYSADVSYATVASTFIENQAAQDGITLLSGPLK
ncbi:acid-sensing ion channel 5 [Elysia marginata]|uniref:Acid-sensing ion channel 5 n=1 Tax=Elysia marginata TaxID=1093978 RepID=A0AAV4GNZ1_9GAST|nr:acid-sensing ion channel 5 [Elysia marginata]